MVVEQRDSERVIGRVNNDSGKRRQDARERLLRTLVWYPAPKTNVKPMTVKDYIYAADSEVRLGKSELSDEGKKLLDHLAPTLADSLWAVRDAHPLNERFPVVIYAPGGGGSASENADLCEYLASHGYVVIASPSVGAVTRDMTYDLIGANAQARDVAFLIDYAQTLSNTDMSKVAVVGYSWGGLSSLFAAARNSRIDALVSLDGSLRYYPSLVVQAGDVHPEDMKLPLLAFTQGEISLEDQQRDFPSSSLGPNVLNEWIHGDLITVHMLGLAHAEFSSMSQRSETVWKKVSLKNDYGLEDRVPGYALIARYTLQVLNGYLKHEAEGVNYLKQSPAEHGVPAHTITVNLRSAEGESAPLGDSTMPASSVLTARPNSP